MPAIDTLLAGYSRFRSDGWPEQRQKYERLSAAGQSPSVMIIGCADSRVDPATIFDTGPGEIFVVRNVANLVPPYETGGGRHGVSAALEFAVTTLCVTDIVVMGHGGCGGVNACLNAHDGQPVGEFIAPWVDIMAPAHARAIDRLGCCADRGALITMLEHEAIGCSLDNLKSFRFVRDAMANGHLRLHGAWFAVASGELHWRNPENGAFDVVAA